MTTVRERLAVLGTVPIFVPLLAAYPVAFLASRNAGQFSVVTALLAASLLVAGVMGFYALFRWRTRNAVAAGVGAVFVLLMFFTFPFFVSLVGSLMTALKLGSNETQYALDAAPKLRHALAFVWATMGWAFGLRLAKSRWANLADIQRALAFAGVALLAVALVPLLFSAARAMVIDADSHQRAAVGARTADLAVSSPDVYFIVLDGYARGDVLHEYYDFDNSPFLNELGRRGFRVADRSSANYNWTFLSISSTLNLGYLQDLYEIDPMTRDRTATYESIRDNATAAFLRKRGYRIVHFQSTWGATASNPYADKEVKCEHQLFDDEFARAFIEATWLSAFSTKATVDLAQCHLANFRALGRIGSAPGPKFVFAHFVMPHHPYLFDRSGNVLRNATVSNQFEFQKRLWEDKQGYLGQLEYVNHLVLEALDRILEGSAAPPIIVLVSDHGPNLAKGLSQNQYAGIRFASLGAYLLPGAPPDLMPSNGSAVNQFRRILRFYFGADLEVLPDHHYYSPYDLPFVFSQVPNDVLRSQWGNGTAEPAHVIAAGDTHQFTDTNGEPNDD